MVPSAMMMAEPPTPSSRSMQGRIVPWKSLAEWYKDWPAAESAQAAVEAEECDATDHAHTDGSVVGSDSGGKNGGAGPMKAGAIKGPGHHSLMAAA